MMCITLIWSGITLCSLPRCFVRAGICAFWSSEETPQRSTDLFTHDQRSSDRITNYWGKIYHNETVFRYQFLSHFRFNYHINVSFCVHLFTNLNEWNLTLPLHALFSSPIWSPARCGAGRRPCRPLLREWRWTVLWCPVAPLSPLSLLWGANQDDLCHLVPFIWPFIHLLILSGGFHLNVLFGYLLAKLTMKMLQLSCQSPKPLNQNL